MTQAADTLIAAFGYKRVKTRRCKYCRAEFQPTRPGAKVCSPECAQAIAEKVRGKIEKATIKAQRERLKSRQDWLKEAQAAFNAWIRARDADEPCISCGRHHSGQYHAGHYRSRGAIPALAFHPDNCHKQCAPCNNHKSGNVVEYRIRLADKIGLDRLFWLEGPHDPKKYTIDELRAIKAEYALKLKQLKDAA